MTSTRGIPSTKRRPEAGPGSIVVGVDGSPASSSAVEWAAREALVRHAPLVLLHAWEWEATHPWMRQYDLMVVRQIERDSTRILEQARLQAVTIGVPEAATHISRGHTSDVLAAFGADPAMIVLGSRHLPAMGRALLGSVSTEVVARAACPVVVLGELPDENTDPGYVVVGVAGMPHDEDVLAFGFDYAQRHELPLRAVLCWHSALGDRTLPPPAVAGARLAESVAGWRDRFPAVEVYCRVRRGDPVAGLVEESTAQALLVVGKRARRLHFPRTLGSVSLGALHHATAPVAVVPPASAASPSPGNG